MLLRRSWGVGLLLMGATVQLTTGCGDSTAPPPKAVIESINLREVGDAYRTYVLAKKAPPKKVADIREYEAGYPMAFAGLKAGELEVFWGGELLQPEAVVPDVKSDTILAFESKVPKEGGYVLLTNREIKKLTPEEFKAAPKAAEASSSTGVAKSTR
ncbi:hypothetical protein SAMN05444166_1753 [Singulisphaera sp. GP187]|uniref:hypothetical protein n=1 Tax=Singulisphaera sp. GP187 TaxID=1882752 RepID=UPI00092B362D|nr:hypothetical protein [Singulisphaera sp. GP187]SIN95110.1 hypothetical protein SAMN05444166_1753 [Singulisphaera sp. GP187]